MELDAVFGGAPAPAIAEAPPPIENPVLTPPEETPAAEAPPVAQTEPPRDEHGQTVPRAAMLEERKRRQEAERELSEYMAERQAPAAASTPDPYDDPQGFQAHIDAQLASQAIGIRFEMSETLARKEHGDEAVQAAMDWGAQRAQLNQGFRDDFLGQKNPIDWVVRQQQRDGLLSELDADQDAFIRRRATEMGWTAGPDAGAGAVSAPGQQAPKPATPPRSIASAPAAGMAARDIATGPLAGVGAAFSR